MKEFERQQKHIADDNAKKVKEEAAAKNRLSDLANQAAQNAGKGANGQPLPPADAIPAPLPPHNKKPTKQQLAQTVKAQADAVKDQKLPPAKIKGQEGPAKKPLRGGTGK